MEQTEPKRGVFGRAADMRLLIGVLAVLVIVVVFSAIQAWSLGQTATRSEVAQTIANVDPACRRIIATTMQTRYMQERRPMTRRELNEVVDGFTSCKAINEQLDGLADAMHQQ